MKWHKVMLLSCWTKVCHWSLDFLAPGLSSLGLHDPVDEGIKILENIVTNHLPVKLE